MLSKKKYKLIETHILKPRYIDQHRCLLINDYHLYCSNNDALYIHYIYIIQCTTKLRNINKAFPVNLKKILTYINRKLG